MATGATLNSFTVDTGFKLQDAGLVTSSQAGTVSAAAVQIDFSLDGSAKMPTPLFRGNIVHDVAAIEVDSSNEVCSLEWQLSDTSGFGSGVFIQSVHRIGDTAVTFESADTTLGRKIIPVTNEINGVTKRYGRLYMRIAGTIGTGFSVASYLVPTL